MVGGTFIYLPLSEKNKKIHFSIISYTHSPYFSSTHQLNGKATKLLFRDKRRQLHLFDVATSTRTTLLPFCSYVQWVPLSDVVVAQSRNNVCIWYSIDSPERVTMFPVKGDVEEIERHDGKTEVIVNEGVHTLVYTLNEGLIEFGAALDGKDYGRYANCSNFLPCVPLSYSVKYDRS